MALAAAFGARLSLRRGGRCVLAWGDHLRAIRANGLRFETPSGETVIRTKASDNPIEVGNVDVVLVGVKAWQVTEAADAMRPLMGSDTVVVPLQNGVEAASELAAVFGIRYARRHVWDVEFCRRTRPYPKRWRAKLT